MTDKWDWEYNEKFKFFQYLFEIECPLPHDYINGVNNLKWVAFAVSRA
jgi:hypothetical protein